MQVWSISLAIKLGTIIYKLIRFANTTGGAICRIFMKWQLICACRKKDLYLWKIMHLWLAQTVASLESGSDTFPTRTTFQKKRSTLISVSFLKEKTAKHPTANRRACRRWQKRYFTVGDESRVEVPLKSYGRLNWWACYFWYQTMPQSAIPSINRLAGIWK